MRSSRRVAVAILIAVVGSVVPSGDAIAVCWRPPVDALVSDPYREPACRWCPGNRGLEYSTRRGQPVVAVDTGRVTYAGTVAGVIYVVVEHRDGRRITYGRLVERRHDEGDLVVRGQVLGRAGERFHLGVRDGDGYVDPAPLIGRWIGRPRLLPVDGRPAAPAPPAVLTCGRPERRVRSANRVALR